MHAFLFSQGGPDRSVDLGAFAFMNHGCRSRYNLGPDTDINEMTADENQFPGNTHTSWEDVKQNPFIRRNARLLMHSMCYANRDIPAGSEIMDNYLNYVDTQEEWRRAVQELRAQCDSSDTQEATTAATAEA